MAKNRMVRPEMWTDDKFVGLTPLARLLFVGMWNFACDNGHLDDSVLQLKMRVLPADDCDLPSLLEELLAAGMVTRRNSFVKVVNLSDKQPIDLRFLVLCDHCPEDPEARYSPEDKKPSRGTHAGVTRESQGRTTGALRSGVGVGDVDGDGVGGTRAKRAGARGKVSTGTPTADAVDEAEGTPTEGSTSDRDTPKRATQLAANFEPNEANRRIAAERGLDLAEVVAQFSDYHRAKGSTYKDWHLALNTWLRRERPGRTAQATSLPLARQIEEPPPGLNAREYDEWFRAQAAKHKAAGQ